MVRAFQQRIPSYSDNSFRGDDQFFREGDIFSSLTQLQLETNVLQKLF